MKLGTGIGVTIPQARVAGGSLPANTAPPTIDNTAPIVGDVLTRTVGTWTGTPSLTTLWKRGGATIGGETGDTYTVASADIGATITTTDHDSVSNTDATSAPTAAVPSNLTTFTVDGVVKNNGATINLANGTTSVMIAATDGGSVTIGPIGNDGLSTGDNFCNFTITAADGVTTLDVTLTLHVLTAGIKERTQLDFTGKSALDFVTAAEGLVLAISSASQRYALWFNTGTETQPDASAVGATAYLQCDINAFASDADCAVSASARLVLAGFSQFDLTGAVLQVEDATIGPRLDAANDNSPVTVSVTQQGADPV